MANLCLLKLLDQMPYLKNEFDSGDWTFSKNTVLVAYVLVPHLSFVKWQSEPDQHSVFNESMPHDILLQLLQMH